MRLARPTQSRFVRRSCRSLIPVLSPPAAAGADSGASSLSSSPERSAVHFDLAGAASGASEGGPAKFKRSLSMAELAAAELVRQEEVGLEGGDDLGDLRRQ